MSVLLETNVGDLVFDLLVDSAPKNCSNFLKLCKIKRYNNALFFSVEKNFIVRAGDQTQLGQSINAELGLEEPVMAEMRPAVKHDRFGTLSMATSKAKTSGSQFFVTLNEKAASLDGQHTIVGRLAEGTDTLKKINECFVDDDHRPIQSIRILHTIVLDDPFEDPSGIDALIPIASPTPIEDEKYDAFKNVEDEIDVLERISKAEAKSRALTLTFLGDLPDAEVRPEESVLFVCKLNPYTEAEDLELLFSRFGRLRSCEIIRDWKTGDSLQYAFVEYEEIKSCETAYFKMQNALVDDRRIHVDWCQSVSKHWAKFKRLGPKGSKDDMPEPPAEDGRTARDESDGKYKYVFDDDRSADSGRASPPPHRGRAERLRRSRSPRRDQRR
eukprot:Polyplicarium_translucidae@DN421_c0_g1_i1.p1